MDKVEPSLQLCIDQQLPLSRRLLQALRSEEQALVNNDVDALEQITVEKNKLVKLLMTGQQQLRRHLAQQGLPTDPASLRRWLDSRPDKPSDSDLLLTSNLQRDAQEINRSNGILLQRLANRNQAGLSALRGQSDTGIYGPTGQNGQLSSFRLNI